MGTRNLTIVKYKNEYKVAQYGQWDGYASGQGSTVLNFCQLIEKHNYRQRFCQKLDAISWYSDEELEVISRNYQESGVLPVELNRNTGAEILEYIYDNPAGMRLRSDLTFAADSLSCEYAYVIDFDTNKLEAYKGFNTEPLTETDRFYFLRDYESDYLAHRYHGIKIVASWDLDNLPLLKEFCNIIDPPVEEE